MSDRKISDELLDKKLGLEMQESCTLSPNFLKNQEKSQTPKKSEIHNLGQ